MAKISLRAYTQEIERLIENKRLDEALAHCHHILRVFPKHIDTYRLFGKAFLEQQRYGDAADLFQRVLSTIPDDFVSHVGMSIIREDEGNLDEALFHLQQASETQPSNVAIQNELRRLYGRKDGIEPPKIRLSRGALARMYVKGELYQQAIVEIRAALAEDANQVDLQILLAQVYLKMGKDSEAIELARTILRKLPNAYHANQILAYRLPENEALDDKGSYRQVVHDLDPYSAYLSDKYATPELVPEQTVTLEKLVWEPTQEDETFDIEPAWAESLGLDLGESRGQAEDEIPDWLKTGGWEPGGAEPQPILEKQGENMDDFFQEPDGEEDLEKADLPDWLKDMAPPESLDQEAALSDAEGLEDSEEDVLPWLEKIFPSNDVNQVAETTGIEDLFSEGADKAEQELPTWLKEINQSQEEEEDIPDWLKTPTDEAKTVWDETPAEETDAELVADIPAWLEPSASEAKTVWDETPAEETDAELAADIPDWLATPADEAKTVWDETPAEEADAELAADIPDWLATPTDEAKTVWDETPAEETDAELAADIPDWLETPASEAKTVWDETPTEETDAELAADIPDWLADPADEAKTVWDETPTEETDAELVADIPAWLEPSASEAKTVWDETPAEETEAELAADIPDWLADPANEAKTAWDETPAEETDAELAADIPAWLEPPANEAKTAWDETPAEETDAELAADIPDWLATPADEAKTVWDETPAEETEAELAADIPDWLADPVNEAKTAWDETHAEEPEAELAADIPDWLADPANEAKTAWDETPAEEPEAELAADIPDWLATPADEAKTVWDETHAEEPEAELAADIPDWLADPANEAKTAWDETPAEEPDAELAADIPDWLSAPADDAKTLWVKTPTEEPDAELAADIPAWLSAPADDAEAVWDETPAEETEAELAADIPAWLSAPADDAETVWDETPAEETEAELAADIPAWLATPADDAEPMWDETPAEETEAELAADIPAWLSAPADDAEAVWDETPAEEPEAEFAADIPAWLSAPADDAETVWDETPAEETEAELAADIPAWLATPADDAEPMWDETPAEETEAELAADIPDWLSRLDEPELDLEDTRPSKTTLASIRQELVEAEEAWPISEIPEGDEIPAANELDDSASQTTAKFKEAATSEDAQQDQASAWLESLAAKQGADQETLFSSDVHLDKTPDWILESTEEDASSSHGEKEFEASSAPETEPVHADQGWQPEESAIPMEAETLAEPLADVIETEKVEEAIAELEEMDDSFAWLESLAARQDADEALLLKPEERQSEAPEWVRLQSQPSPETIEEQSETQSQTPLEAESHPDETTIEALDEQPQEETVQPDELPQWEETSSPELPEPVEALVDTPTEQPQEEAAQPDEWLAPESLQSEDISELPAWLADAEATTEDEVLDWTPPAKSIRPIEINQASLVELERLPGVGFRLAQEIIAYREQHGEIISLEQLSQVPGAEDLNLQELAAFLVFPQSSEPDIPAEVSESDLTFSEVSELPELETARQALLKGDLQTSLNTYHLLIEKEQDLPSIVQDLDEALRLQPDSFDLWLTLGDAYQRSDRVREALSAYLKAQELLG